MGCSLAGCSQKGAVSHEPAPPLLLSPSSVAFGRVAIGCPVEREVTGFNVSGAPLAVGEITAPAGSRFSVSAETGTLSADESGTFVVRYLAKEAGADVAKVSIAVEGHAPVTVDVSAEAVASPVEEEKHTQVKGTPLDVLFVVDGAPSMAEERAALDGAMAQLLPVGFEHHASTVVIGSDADSMRRGMEVAYRGVSGWLKRPAAPAASSAPARRAVVFVSDEDDQSVASRDHFAAFFRAAGVTAHAVVSPDNLACADAQYAPRYAEVAEKTGGVVVSVCQPAWAELASALSGMRARFPLRGTPVESSLEVRVDGAVVAPDQWRFDGRAIVFAAAAVPAAGSTITVRYTPACSAS